jgi:hypothetical protein
MHLTFKKPRRLMHWGGGADHGIAEHWIPRTRAKDIAVRGKNTHYCLENFS